MAEKKLKKGTLSVKELRSDLCATFKRMTKYIEKDEPTLNTFDIKKCRHCNKPGHADDDCHTLLRKKDKFNHWKRKKKTAINQQLWARELA